MNGYINIDGGNIVITDSDSAYLNGEYTLPEGTTIELRNSTLILMYNLYAPDENSLIGDRYSEIVERGGFLYIGADADVRGHESEITPGSYYYDVKRHKWRAMK